MTRIELTSEAFADHTAIPRRHARDGDDISPPLTWTGVPDGAAELLLLCEDPDAPRGTFLHWLVTGIDPATGGAGAGRTPAGGTARRNGFGGTGWGGPYPPPGPEHRYVFHLYALRAPADLPAGATPEDVHRAVADRTLGHGTLVGLYRR